MGKSLWIENSNKTEYEKLKDDIVSDYVIIGGGIAGLTTAYLLTKQGLKVTVVEADRVGFGCSGRNTGKVTFQHNVIYSKIKKDHGLDVATKYYEANKKAFNLIETLITENNIDCDFENVPAYIFTENNNNVQMIKDEEEVCKEIGIDCVYHDTLDIPFNVKAALSFNNQGQFNPKKYIDGLAKLIIEQGSVIYENTPIVDLKNEGEVILKCRNGRVIKARRTILCSHIPWYDGAGLYFVKLKPERSYVIAGKYEGNLAEGMYINIEEPRRTFRQYDLNGEKNLVFGGENHKVGQGKNSNSYFDILIQDAKEKFNVNEIKYKWSAQDYMTPDHIPHIGYLNVYDKNIYVATGFSKWGMTNGTVAAVLLVDLITKKQSEFEEIFSPSRSGTLISTDIVKENINVGIEYIKGKLKIAEKELPNENGEGIIVKINKKKYGAYKDDNGKLHIVDNTCTHLGCELTFNNDEKTWDCPCHGSRFSYKGDVLEGPATNKLVYYSMGQVNEEENVINPHLI